MNFVWPCIKSMRNKDLFGHLITLNFNKRGQYHRTSLGGCFSILIKVFIYVYVLLNFVTLFTYGANKNFTLNGYTPVMDLGKVYLNQTDTTVYYVMRNQVGWSALWLGDELRRYVDIYF